MCKMMFKIRHEGDNLGLPHLHTTKWYWTPCNMNSDEKHIELCGLYIKFDQKDKNKTGSWFKPATTDL